MKNTRRMSIGVWVLSLHWIRITKFSIQITDLRKIKKEEEESGMSLRLKISFFSLQVFQIPAIAFIKIKNAMDKNFRKAGT